MRKKFALTFLLCLAATPGLAQSRLNGKWATDKPEDLNAVPGLQRTRSVQLELSIEDARASGALAIGGLGGTFMTFKDGKVNGNKLQFRTTPAKDPNAVTTWTVELVDDNTVHDGNQRATSVDVGFLQRGWPGDVRRSSSREVGMRR